MKNVILIIVLMAVAVVAGRLTIQHREPVVLSQEDDKGIYHVMQVYDGDTVKLNNGEHVRLIGIDTPESKDNPKLERDMKRLNQDKEAILAMGRKAAQYSDRLLSDEDVRIEYDVEKRDRYKRLLAYVYLLDGTFVNEKIIRDGYAYPLTVPPNVRHADDFKRWFDEARRAKRGLWKE